MSYAGPTFPRSSHPPNSLSQFYLLTYAGPGSVRISLRRLSSARASTAELAAAGNVAQNDELRGRPVTKRAPAGV